MRDVSFSASHRLHSPALTDAENVHIFGKCNNANGHGHNYLLRVALKGELDPVTGMVSNLTKLADLIDRTIKVHFDHTHLNLDTDLFKDRVPTSENIAIVCWELLRSTSIGDMLHYVEVQETSKNRVRFAG
ncbi:6-carboxytetrahydropterin synthase [Mycobacterium simiae]|uniref:6-carboxy-5,6,7,8-tetrahydropterin synthase n=2 Tax=Mycobacterium simiae TaxID=1784 RepID=A0A5B1BSE4_MYCSI|nr:6-carboxytetrahydropterin synthase [Mycobacterium simiae]